MKTVIAFLSVPVLVAFALAWLIVIMRRARIAWANINQVYPGPPTSRRQITTPTNVTSGQPLLKGVEPCVTMDNYQANVGGMTAQFGGTFALTVTAKSSLSPSTNKAINPGDPIYADGGTLDATTNVTSGFTLDANSGGTLFGHLDPSAPVLTSGTTAVVNVVVVHPY